MKAGFFDHAFGYVGFTATGEYPERLFNRLAESGVKTWGIRRSGNSIKAYMPLKSYRKIRRLRGRSGVGTRVSERVGLPFLLRRYRLRVGLAAGAAVFFFTLYFLSSFVWNIEISAPDGIDKKEVLSVCRELGLYEGVRKSSLDTEKLRTKLVLAVDGASWASVNVDGAKATVNVSLSIGEKADEKQPCDLIAARDGIITAMEVRSGTAKVRVGQTVAKGELLVSGITEYKEKESTYGPSAGRVTAVTEHTLTVSEDFEITRSVRTGKPFCRRVLTVFGLNIPLYFGSVDRDAETEIKVLRYGRNGMYLPVTLTEKTYYPVQDTVIKRSAGETKAAAETTLLEAEKTAFFDAEILTRELAFEETGNGIVITARYTVSEDIAEEDFMLIYGKE